MDFVYAFRTNLMRATTAIFLLAAFGSPGCANRGMHAPDDGSGVGGNAGTAGIAGRGGQGGTTGRGGTGGTAPGGTGGATLGTAGTGGTGGAMTGTSGTGGGTCNVVATDGGATGGACGATFNFESDVQGATINSGSSAFQKVAKSSAFTYCGSGALAITAMFSGTSGATTKGEVLINLPASPIDLTGKTITVHVAADPGCSNDLNLSLVLNTQAGPVYFTPAFPIRPVTNAWKTGIAMVTAVAGSTSALALSLQAFSSTGYQGTIYVDEIDIR
jgi:hypothetical protein